MPRATFLDRLLPAQLELLELKIQQHERIFLQGRPDPMQNRMLAIGMSSLGPEVTPQELGRFLARRVKQLEGKPTQQRKTPEQVVLLQESFDHGPLPNAHDVILLIESTGLSREQINAWFDHKRTNLPFLEDSSEQLEETPSQILGAFKKDPEAYTASIHERRRLAREQGERDFLVYQEDARRLARLRETDPAQAAEEEARDAELSREKYREWQREKAEKEAEIEERRRGMTPLERQYDEMRVRVANGFRGRRTYVE